MNTIIADRLSAGVFESVMIHSLGKLAPEYYGDFYFNAIFLHKFFRNWNGVDPPKFWLIVQADRTHLTCEWGVFEVRRRHLYINEDEPFPCFQIETKRDSLGVDWVIETTPLSHRNGTPID